MNRDFVFAGVAVVLILGLGFPATAGRSAAAGQPASAAADRKPYALDQNHSQVNFVAEARLLGAHGSFDKFDAELEVDPENLENSTLTFTIDAASINTRVAMRDNDLRGARFFDVANNPQIKFVSTKISKVDNNNLLITGDLTIRSTTKSIQVPTRIVFFENNQGRFRGAFKINRQDYGVSGNSRMNPIEDEVAVEFDFHVAERRQQPAGGAPQAPPAKKPPQQ